MGLRRPVVVSHHPGLLDRVHMALAVLVLGLVATACGAFGASEPEPTPTATPVPIPTPSAEELGQLLSQTSVSCREVGEQEVGEPGEFLNTEPPATDLSSDDISSGAVAVRISRCLRTGGAEGDEVEFRGEEFTGFVVDPSRPLFFTLAQYAFASPREAGDFVSQRALKSGGTAADLPISLGDNSAVFLAPAELGDVDFVALVAQNRFVAEVTATGLGDDAPLREFTVEVLSTWSDKVGVTCSNERFRALC